MRSCDQQNTGENIVRELDLLRERNQRFNVVMTLISIINGGAGSMADRRTADLSRGKQLTYNRVRMAVLLAFKER